MSELYREHEWFGIPVSVARPDDPESIADAAFYDRFYREMARRYLSFDDFPVDWRKKRRAVAEAIMADGADEDLVSIGCGAGYVEHLLTKAGRRVVGVEPASRATWLLEREGGVRVFHGYFPDALPADVRMSYAYMVATEYAIVDADLVKLVRAARERGAKTFSIVSASVLDDGVKARAKAAARRVRDTLRPGHEGQVWGYLRTRDELASLLRAGGYPHVEVTDIEGSAHTMFRGTSR